MSTMSSATTEPKPKKKARRVPAKVTARASASEIRSALGITATELENVRRVLRELGMLGAK